MGNHFHLAVTTPEAICQNDFGLYDELIQQKEYIRQELFGLGRDEGGNANVVVG
jgi:hypothetical protein